MADVLYGGGTAAHFAELGYPSGYTSVVDGSEGRRVRVSGKLTQVRAQLYSAVLTLQNVTVRVWRDSIPENLDCQTLVGSCAIGEVSDNVWYTLSTPIDVRAGDAVGLSYTTPAGSGMSMSATTGVKLLFENSNKAASGAWANSVTTRNLSLEFNGTPPHILTYGDSISGGRSGNTDASWRPGLATDFYTNAVLNFRNSEYDYSAILRTRLGGVAAMACGEGGQDASYGVTNYAARVTPYASSGAFLICNWGINDLVLGTQSYADHQADWDTLLSNATTDGLRLIRQEILYLGAAYSYGGHDGAYYNALIDTWNNSMATWCAANLVKNIRVNLKWQAGWIGTTDNIHPVLAAYKAIAKYTKQVLKPSRPGTLLPI